MVTNNKKNCQKYFGYVTILKQLIRDQVKIVLRVSMYDRDVFYQQLRILTKYMYELGAVEQESSEQVIKQYIDSIFNTNDNSES